MFKALLFFILNVLVILGLSAILPNFEVSNFTAAAIFLIILTFLNWLIGPILKTLSLPINLLTFGLASWFINVLLVWFTTLFVEGIVLSGSGISKFITLVLVSIGLSIGHSLIEDFLGKSS